MITEHRCERLHTLISYVPYITSTSVKQALEPIGKQSLKTLTVAKI